MKMGVKQIAVWAILAALCIAIQVTPRPPNVEFTSLICFLAGFLFGGAFGVAVGTLTMALNGFLSPWGFGGMLIPFQIVGMGLMGLGGGLYRKFAVRSDKPSIKTFSLEVTMLAVILTVAYDLITNFGFSIMFNVNFGLAIVSGVWFAIIHTVSNAALFGTTLYGLVNIVSRVLGEKIWCKQEPLSSSVSV